MSRIFAVQRPCLQLMVPCRPLRFKSYNQTVIPTLAEIHARIPVDIIKKIRGIKEAGS